LKCREGSGIQGNDITALTTVNRLLLTLLWLIGCVIFSIKCEASDLLSLWNVRFKNWKCILLISIDYRIGWIICDIFDREIVSKHFIQTASSKTNEVSFCFSKTFLIRRCLRSKSSLFDKRNDILHLATPTYKQTRFKSRSNLNLRIFPRS
jgi:hypothetical protein